MNKNALVLVGGWSSPDLEWKLSPIHKMSGHYSFEGNGPDIFIFRKCSMGYNDIVHNGKELHDFVESVKWKGYKNVFIAGHSMGGLVARVAEIWSDRLIDGLITLATPHGGSPLATVGGFSTSARQMVPGSEFLRKLDENPARCPVFSVVCKFDEVVPKLSAQYLPKDGFGGKTKEYNLTHIGPLFSRRVANDVLWWVHDQTK